jgi:hypothetical protein
MPLPPDVLAAARQRGRDLAAAHPPTAEQGAQARLIWAETTPADEARAS